MIGTRTGVLAVLHGQQAADLAITNGRLVDVHLRTIRPADVAIKDGIVVKVGDVADLCGPDTRTVDATGKFVSPGLIDAHVHAYHGSLNYTEFARLVIPRGSTATVESAYFAAMMAGADGVRFFMEEMRRSLITPLFTVPVGGWLQNRQLGLAPRHTTLADEDLLEMVEWPDCVSVEEPPFIPVDEQDPVVSRLMERALELGKPVMGHAAGLTPGQVTTYAAMGITGDHECVDAEEARVRVEHGMVVAMRECALARNQQEVQKAITELGCDPDYFMYCGDGVDAATVAERGYMDHCVRTAISAGIDPVQAIRMGSLIPARYYRVEEWIGSVSPGRQADVLLLDDLASFAVHSVVAKGRVVYEDGEFAVPTERPLYPSYLRNTVTLARPATAEDVRVPVPREATHATARVIGADQLVSDARTATLPVVDGNVTSDLSQDVLKLALWDRSGVRQKPGLAFLQGYGLKRGAMGASYNTLIHDVMVLGTNDADMALCANTIADLGGGLVVVADGEVLASLPLPLLGLVSDGTAEEVTSQLQEINRALADLGCVIDSPFASFALVTVVGEVPFVKMGPEGIFDVIGREYLDTIVEIHKSGQPDRTVGS